MRKKTIDFRHWFNSRREIIAVSWKDIDDLFVIDGEDDPYSGERDPELKEALIRSGAPEWVRGAEGYIEDDEWGLYGPELDEDSAKEFLEILVEERPPFPNNAQRSIDRDIEFLKRVIEFGY